MQEPSIFLAATHCQGLKRGKESLLISGQQLCLCLVGQLQSLCPLAGGGRRLQTGIEPGRQLVHKAPLVPHPPHPVETCQAASPKALHLFLKNARKEIYGLPSSSLFGSVYCAWRSFWSTQLWFSSLILCAPMLNSSGRK
jgi:hypothetical protein